MENPEKGTASNLKKQHTDNHLYSRINVSVKTMDWIIAVVATALVVTLLCAMIFR